MHDLRMEVAQTLGTILCSPDSEFPILKRLGFHSIGKKHISEASTPQAHATQRSADEVRDSAAASQYQNISSRDGSSTSRDGSRDGSKDGSSNSSKDSIRGSITDSLRESSSDTGMESSDGLRDEASYSTAELHSIHHNWDPHHSSPSLHATQTGSSAATSMKAGRQKSKSPSPASTYMDDHLADQLASFLSRIKYLYDESEHGEALPVGMPSNSNFSDQRALIKTQAAKVRNQLDLKYSLISFTSQLDKFAEANWAEPNANRYNPLQVIRDRKKRPKPVKGPRSIMWMIPLSEQIQDTRWRYRATRMRAHKQRRTQRKKRSVSRDYADRPEGSHERNNSAHESYKPNDATMMTPPRATREYTSGFTGGSEEHARSHSKTFSNDFTFFSPSSVASFDRSPDGPTRNLPKSDCMELIERLKSSHSGVSELASSSAESTFHDNLGSNSSYGNLNSQVAGRRESWSYNGRKSSTGGSIGSQSAGYGASSASSAHDLSVPPDADETVNENNMFWGRSRFCRNSASVANTWNRLYHPRAGSAGTQPDDDHLKPLSTINTRGSAYSQSGGSTYSSAIVDGDEPDGPSCVVDSSYPVSARESTSSSYSDIQAQFGLYAERPKIRLNSNPAVSEVTPVLTLTPEDGAEQVLGERKPTNNISSLRKNSSKSDVSDMKMDDVDEPGHGFGSLRSASTEGRKDPYERIFGSLQSDLRFLVPYYTIILRHDDPAYVYERASTKLAVLTGSHCHQRSDRLKSELTPQYLRYLSKVEHSVVSEQQILDAQIASSLDGLRVTTDLMVSDVNTTLNRRIREVSSRMERLYACRGEACVLITMSYALIEYAVLFIMWVIWCFVQVTKPIKWLLKLMCIVCSNFIVA